MVTAVGSMPGSDPQEAARIVAGELDVPHVAELPARGPGADMVGRTLGMVVAATGEFAAETTPTGWRLAGVRAGGDPGRQMRRAASWLAEDADRLEEHLLGFTGTLKLQVAGPWTLAATVETTRGTALLADAGACADLAGALAEAVAAQVEGFARRVPAAARLVVQLDEPLLDAVVAGRIGTPSGRGRVRAPGTPELVDQLGRVAGAVRARNAVPAVHSCARTVPTDILARAGFDLLSVDAVTLGARADEDLGRWWDAGGTVVLGVAPALDAPGATPDALASLVAATWSRIGFAVADVGPRTWLSPTCGLAGASPAWARQVGGLLRRTARLLESAD